MTDGHELVGVNSIPVGDEVNLLAGGNKAHLVPAAETTGPSQAAVPAWRFDRVDTWQSEYDQKALAAEYWSPRTLCGRPWQRMALGDGPAMGMTEDPVYSPTCKACMRIVGSGLASTPQDDRVALVARVAVDEAVDRGSARVVGVPGDQVDSLRARLRAEFRSRGHRCGTFVQSEIVFAWSEEELPAERQAVIDAEVRDALIRLGDQEAPVADRSIRWSTWG